jgi:hypothetical protein
VADRDLPPGGGRSFHVLLDGVVQRKFVLLGQLHDGNRHERLGNRPDVKYRLRSSGDFQLDVSQSVALCLDDRSVSADIVCELINTWRGVDDGTSLIKFYPCVL